MVALELWPSIDGRGNIPWNADSLLSHGRVFSEVKI
jgi:hypothetical protein